MIIFFFKQKTAYEMRISDWSSDVCSSDLPRSGGKLIDEAFGEKGGGAVRARPPDARFKSGIGMAMRHLQRRNVIGRDRALDRISIRALVDRYSRQIGKHTSELQSLMRISYAVFCLKKKITANTLR